MGYGYSLWDSHDLFLFKTNYMKNFISSLFKDNNQINEKSVLGFSSFIVMIIFAVTDIVTGYMGKSLVINEFIFNSFLIMTLGSLGIASVDKYINMKKGDEKDGDASGEL